MDLNTPYNDWLSSRGTAFDLLLLPIHLAQMLYDVSVGDLKQISGYSGGGEVREQLLMLRSNSFRFHLLSCPFCQFQLHIKIKIQVQPPIDQGHLQLWKLDKFIHIPLALYNMCSQQKDGRLLFFFKVSLYSY